MSVITEELKTRAEEIKNEANILFKGTSKLIVTAAWTHIFTEKKFPAAVQKYTEAIQVNPNVASYYTNRAFCHLKLESYGYAIAYVCFAWISFCIYRHIYSFFYSDSDSALQVDPNFTKVKS